MNDYVRFAYEVMFKVTSLEGIDGTNVKYHGILDYEENGGWGLNVHLPKSGTVGNFSLEVETSAGKSSGWKAEFYELKLNEWYHCVVVYNVESTDVYINGTRVGGTANITEPYCVPSFTGGVSPYICIGGCAQSVASGAGVNGFHGAIAIANIYADAITVEEVLELYNAAIGK